jgi:hypothetical protein
MRYIESIKGTPGLTDDRNDPALRETGERGMQKKYLVLSDAERARGFVRPLRRSYVHARAGSAIPCGAVTTMGMALCETYARDPKFYGGTYCARCHAHFPVDQFDWAEDGLPVGS